MGSPIDRIKAWVEAVRARVAAVDLAISTFKRFSENDGGTYAAALTYYTFFSMFPLLLFAAAILGYLTFGNDALRERVFDAGVGAFPMMTDILKPDAIRTIEERRQELAAFGLVLALYTGSGAVVAFEHALNRILSHRGDEPNWISKRLRALRWLLILGSGALLSASFSAAATFSAGLFGFGEDSIVATLVGHVGGFVVGALVFATAYRFLPARRQEWRDVLPGALLAALLFELLKIAGAAYLEVGSKAREATFGALASAAGLLVAAYLISQIALLCAQLNVVLVERENKGQSRDDTT